MIEANASVKLSGLVKSGTKMVTDRVSKNIKVVIFFMRLKRYSNKNEKYGALSKDMSVNTCVHIYRMWKAG